MIELELADTSNPMGGFEVPGQPGAGMGSMMNIGDLFGKMGMKQTVKKKMTVADSYDALIADEADKLLDDESVTKTALEAVEKNGIVFLDEIDKVCAKSDARGADVSREGVQRDLLPLIEGTTVSTKHGPIKTDHILFVASGAFHVAKPSDLLPELQGRLPIRVELRALMKVTFAPEGIAALAKIAAEVNESVENIGARRLYTVMERVFEDLSFNAPDKAGDEITVDAAFVEEHLGELSRSTDVSRYVL